MQAVRFQSVIARRVTACDAFTVPRLIASLVILVMWLGIAAAEPTTLTGRVTDVFGKAISGARIYVLPRAGGRKHTTTDSDGRYSIELSTRGSHGVVIAIGKAHTFRTAVVVPGRANKL